MTFATPGKAHTTGAYTASHTNLGLIKNVSVFVGGGYTRMSDSRSRATVDGGIKVAF